MALDSNSGNKDLMIRWLGEVIHREISKPDDETDMELVEECEETLQLLSNSISYSEEELDERLRMILRKESKQMSRHNKSHGYSMRRVAVIAACVAALLLGSLITAYAFVPAFQDYIIKQVIGLPNGSEIEEDGITFQNAGKYKKYATLGELIEAEQLDDSLLFPIGLTEEIRITEILVINFDDQIHFGVLFSDPNINMDIEPDPGINVDELALASEIIVYNGIEVYISDSDGVCASVAIYDGYVYYISADTRDKTTTIIESVFDRSL